MNTLATYLQQVPSSNDPLSADVYLIHGERCEYLFDVGNNEESLRVISGITKDKVVILSHLHDDHIGNIDNVDYKELYVGDLTYEKIRKGKVVENELLIHDGVKMEIKHCPSPHTGGSLIVTINNEYTLLADLYFTRPVFDRQAAHSMMEVLKAIETKYFVASHQAVGTIFEKDLFVKEMEEYFK